MICTIDRTLLMDAKGHSTGKVPIVIALTWPNKYVAQSFHYFLVCFQAIFSFQYASILLGYIIEDTEMKFKKVFRRVKGLALFRDFVIFIMCTLLMGLTNSVDFLNFVTRYFLYHLSHKISNIYFLRYFSI